VSDYTIIDDGPNRYATGLIVPDERPRVFTRYADSAFPVLDWSTIKELATSQSRSMGRNRFGSNWIRNQGSRGSCNGYAGAKCLERARVLRGLDWTPLSGEGLYAQINGGRDRGSGLQAGMEALVRNGVPPESMVPHEEYRWSRISREAKEACDRFKAQEPLGVDTWQELCSGLALGFVGVVAVHASNRWSRLDSNGIAGESHGVGNHSVIVDDVVYIEGEPFVDDPNSWGTNWGWEGRAYLSWDRHFARTINYHDFYLIPTTGDDPDEDNAPFPDGDERQDDTPQSDVLVEMETSQGCRYCRDWKREELPKAKALGWSIQEKTPTGGVPKFTLRVGGMSHEFARGYQSVGTMKDVAATLRH
jgi:hypothetical protein